MADTARMDTQARRRRCDVPCESTASARRAAHLYCAGRVPPSGFRSRSSICSCSSTENCGGSPPDSWLWYATKRHSPVQVLRHGNAERAGAASSGPQQEWERGAPPWVAGGETALTC